MVLMVGLECLGDLTSLSHLLLRARLSIVATSYLSPLPQGLQRHVYFSIDLLVLIFSFPQALNLSLLL